MHVPGPRGAEESEDVAALPSGRADQTVLGTDEEEEVSYSIFLLSPFFFCFFVLYFQVLKD